MNRVLTGLILAALAGSAALAVENQKILPDVDGDRTVTRAEMQANSAQIFARMDANKDGKLDAADREARQASMFDMIDTDKSGQISRAEFTAHHRDGNHADGDVHQGMGHRMGGRHGEHGGGMMKMMHTMADTDKNGSVSQAEFTASAAQHFDRMDANKDGQVTREERRAAHMAMRGKMDGHGMHQMDAPATPSKPAN